MKRFLQGLGLGLVIAAIAMGVNSRGEETLSGDSLVERARELGMVFPQGSGKPDAFSDEEASSAEPVTPSPAAEGGEQGAGVGAGGDDAGNEADADSDSKDNKDEDKAAATETPAAPTVEPSKEPSPTPDATKKPHRTRRPRTTSSPRPEESSDPNATPHPRTTELPAGTVVQFTVRQGLLSSSVARELYEAGVIDDMWAFDHYIENHGLGHNIITGTYELRVGDSYAHIARIITHTS